jgi:integrase
MSVPVAIGTDGMNRDTSTRCRARRGAGSIREKRPGYWEIRVVVASGPTVQRSFTVRGTRSTAETRRDELVDEYGAATAFPHGAILSVGELLQSYVDAPQMWKPATVNSHRSVSRFLIADKLLADVRLTALTPSVAVAAIRRWKSDGATDPTISARWLVLRGSLSWATAEGLLRRNPLLGMRGPARPEPRMHLTIDEIHKLLSTAVELAKVARARSIDAPENANLRRDLFVAEQTLLLVRLAADTGARRGELAALRMADLEGRVLRIERGVSGGELGSTKTKRTRRITVGQTTVEMLRAHTNEFPGDGVAGHDWLFAPDATRSTFARAERLSHRFDRVKAEAGTEQASLHRFRHSVATYLVGRGLLLAAQYRLGHGHFGTTARHYTHATALGDDAIADEIDALLNDARVGR